MSEKERFLMIDFLLELLGAIVEGLLNILTKL